MLLETLEGTLGTLGLTVRNIRGITTDGASVMLKLGRLLLQAVGGSPSSVEGRDVSETAIESRIPFFHMLCMAHAIHLAVLDTFKQPIEEESERVPETDAEEVATWNFVDADIGKFSALAFRESMSNDRRCYVTPRQPVVIM